MTSDDDNLLARWSRLKREHSRENNKQKAARPADAPSSFEPKPDASDEETSAAFDISTLPPLESIVAGSDVRAFLQKGVPAALARAALSRAWSSDPAIRDFIEMAENQWDFANPETIPGFGPLRATDDVRQLVAKAFGEWRDDRELIAESYGGSGPPQCADKADTAVVAGPPDDKEVSSDEALPSLSSREMTSAPQQASHEENALEQIDTTEPTARPRRHGSALPS
jgi:hypothetical protein